MGVGGFIVRQHRACALVGALLNGMIVLLLGFFVFVNYWSGSYMPNLMYHQFYPGTVCAAVMVDTAYRATVEQRDTRLMWMNWVVFIGLNIISLICMIWFAAQFAPNSLTGYTISTVFAGDTTFGDTDTAAYLTRNTTSDESATGRHMYLGVFSLGMVMLGAAVWNIGVAIVLQFVKPKRERFFRKYFRRTVGPADGPRAEGFPQSLATLEDLEKAQEYCIRKGYHTGKQFRNNSFFSGKVPWPIYAMRVVGVLTISTALFMTGLGMHVAERNQ